MLLPDIATPEILPPDILPPEILLPDMLLLEILPLANVLELMLASVRIVLPIVPPVIATLTAF